MGLKGKVYMEGGREGGLEYWNLKAHILPVEIHVNVFILEYFFYTIYL